ncbi:MAG TPA: hypothetical protein VGB77_01510, partial [Abditibacteriaceae bacterium]
MDGIIGAIISAIFSIFVTWKIAKSDSSQKNDILQAQLRTAESDLRESKEHAEKLRGELNSLKNQVAKLCEYEKKHGEMKKKLQAGGVIKEYTQPVLLVGPRFIGKTSLLMQWHAPWDHSRLSATRTHHTSMVPIYDFKRDNVEPHFADPDILTDVHVHLKLKVHDFPGEIDSQHNIIAQAKKETLELRKKTGKRLGIVLICMFDAEEADKGVSPATIEYYNGELFSNLRQLVGHNEIGIERL